MSKRIPAMLGLMAAMGAAYLPMSDTNDNASCPTGNRKHVKSHLTKKQRKSRAKEKARRKANNKQRRRHK